MNIGVLITIYGLFIIAFAIFSIVGIYHLRRFGYAGDLTKPAILLYSLLSLLVIVISFVVIFYEIYGVL
ncbi:MAG TPA: hypothetical protein VJK08_01275 [Patescibacteria group bacterium]|nr:hypothetical protein [Patescibacteria group bacterium]